MSRIIVDNIPRPTIIATRVQHKLKAENKCMCLQERETTTTTVVAVTIQNCESFL